jgi:hypothetical protein
MNSMIGIIASGLLVAFIARRFVTRFSGLTYTRQNKTGYVPLNIVAFWLSIASTIVIWMLYWSGR